MLKKLALLIAVMYGSVSAQNTTGTEGATLVPGTIYTTGNIVQQTTTGSGSTWTGAVYQDQLTCWAGGDPGYCGPNAIVRPGNQLNFSYGSTYVYQQQHISTLLPSVTGLQVNGYNFGFMAKNGNGWDDGRTDQLTALVRFWDNTGYKGTSNLLYGTSYDLSYQYNWTQFNYSETFTKPLAASDVGLVQYGFIGRDNNFWAGPYGPELYNISFSLKYSIDPCIKDPLYSPTCPGYLEALNKLLPPAPTVVADPVTATTTSAGTTTTVVTDPVASTVSVSSSTSIGQPSVVASVVSAPAPTTSSTSSSSTSSSTTSTSSQTAKETTQSSGGSTSLALSVISKNSERDAAGSAVAQSAVAQAQQAATQAQQEATSVAASAVANSTTMNAASVGGQQSSGNGIRVNNNNSSNSTNFTLQSGITSMAVSTSGPQSTNNNTTVVQQQNSSGLGLNLSNSQPVIVTNTTQQATATESVSTFAIPLLQPQQSTSTIAPSIVTVMEQTQVQQQVTMQSNTITQSNESYASVPNNFLTDKSNPLTDIVEGKNTVPQSNTVATTGPSVNRNASDNEVAGGVDLNKMALAPVGYGDYLSLTLRDASFYAPKEVYRNQRNVDNVRALRQLSNDSKHKEMVEQQYKGK